MASCVPVFIAQFYGAALLPGGAGVAPAIGERMADSPTHRPIKPIAEMTPLELENYRALLRYEMEQINVRWKCF